jgi:hypothetical protein
MRTAFSLVAFPLRSLRLCGESISSPVALARLPLPLGALGQVRRVDADRFAA